MKLCASAAFLTLLALLMVSCSGDTSPTSSAPISGTTAGSTVSQGTASAQTTVTARRGPFSQSEDEDFNCTNVQDVRVRFSDPGWVQDNVVGLFVKFVGVQDTQMTLRIWWDIEGAPDIYQDVPLEDQDLSRNGDLLDIEKIIEHTYLDIRQATQKKVRVEVILADQTGNCARVREVLLTPPARPEAAGGGFCQPFNLVGFTCPTGATQFCDTAPIVATNAAQAQAACQACYGAPCYLEYADCAGPGYGPNPAGSYVCDRAYFGYQNGCSGASGRIWAICHSYTTYGRWAP